ncbi:Peptidase propeptide and YPEB domain-containing protein [Poseidonocella pacifica]|uniref:Peptidase propeptide and YPEB domain-containing protein n=1 Tax=Poseidonocella pacifica TaxID=871651 RepID=A0A1I0X7P3_9RHOB|nr:PepSY domain-containing protein [Poseidonocella pacifica]SFA96874.1 Peptidase propeptide and YPEB domain-containing protein [Poseidonocella pacifica]
MRRFGIVGLSFCILAGPAVALDICEGGPRSEWMTEEAVHARVLELGYTGSHVLAIEDGCIEVKLIHDGKRLEIYLEPITGAVAKIKD